MYAKLNKYSIVRFILFIFNYLTIIWLVIYNIHTITNVIKKEFVMVEKSNKNTVKKEMPESIKKLFEQKQNGALQQETKSIVDNDGTNFTDNYESDKGLKQTEPENEIKKVDTLQDTKKLKKAKNKKENNKIQENKKEKTKNLKNEQDVENADEKDNRKKLSKKTKIIILSVLLAVVCCAFIITLTVFLLPKANKMSAPTVQVYSLSNQTILHIDENDDAILYEFYIQKKGETNITYISSQTNEISIKSKLSSPGEYYIWARYGGRNSQETSDDSQKYIYHYYEHLDTPNVYVSNDGTKLSWLKVVNAKEYKVYYGITDQNLNYFTVVQPSATTTNVEFYFSEFNSISAGNYTLYVQAVADENNYYKSSELSKPIVYAHKTKLQNVISANYNSGNNMLTFKIDIQKTPTKRFEILVNDNETFGYVADLTNETYTLDLTPYLTKGTSVSSIKIKAVGDGDYITDSDYIDVTIQ